MRILYTDVYHIITIQTCVHNRDRSVTSKSEFYIVNHRRNTIINLHVYIYYIIILASRSAQAYYKICILYYILLILKYLCIDIN